jgi:hypothetical protein
MVRPVAASQGPTQSLKVPASIEQNLPLTGPDRYLLPAIILVVIGGCLAVLGSLGATTSVPDGIGRSSPDLLRIFSKEIYISGYLVGGIVLLLGILSLRARRKQNRLNALLRAAGSGQSDVVSSLISLNDVNVKDKMGDTVLMKAAENGHYTVVKLLIVHGADVGKKNPFGQTALMKARASGHLDIVALLEQAEVERGRPV